MGTYLQLTLMSIPPGEDASASRRTPRPTSSSALEQRHGGIDESQLNLDQEVEDGWAIMVPAGTWHNVTNIGEEPLRLYAVYAPAHHAAGSGARRRQADAERDEESGADEPPDVVRPAGWSTPSDEHA